MAKRGEYKYPLLTVNGPEAKDLHDAYREWGSATMPRFELVALLRKRGHTTYRIPIIIGFYLKQELLVLIPTKRAKRIYQFDLKWEGY